MMVNGQTDFVMATVNIPMPTVPLMRVRGKTTRKTDTARIRMSPAGRIPVNGKTVCAMEKERLHTKTLHITIKKQNDEWRERRGTASTPYLHNSRKSEACQGRLLGQLFILPFIWL